jgi:hypothetical protein
MGEYKEVVSRQVWGRTDAPSIVFEPAGDPLFPSFSKTLLEYLFLDLLQLVTDGFSASVEKHLVF